MNQNKQYVSQIIQAIQEGIHKHNGISHQQTMHIDYDNLMIISVILETQCAIYSVTLNTIYSSTSMESERIHN